jgi:hypothetical protein
MVSRRGSGAPNQRRGPLDRALISHPRGVLATLVESVALLVAPVAVFFALHIRAMPRTEMIDPYFYGAYALDGHDLLQRFGPGNYFWPRVGFILPDTLLIHLFGALGGFFSFRYVLALVAVIPVYLLFRQQVGRGVAWIAVLVVLTAPVVLTAWGTDYPDSSAVSYLMAGGACLLMAGSVRRRWILTISAGFFFALALNSQIIAIFTVAGVLAGWLASRWVSGRAALIRDFGGLAAGVLVTTAALVGFSEITLGHWDIFRPTAHAIIAYRSHALEALFHSSTWRWLLDDFYVLCPPALVVAWTIAARPLKRSSVLPAELGFAVATAGAYLLHVFFQFIGTNWTLEYYLYTSMLWATVCPLLVFTAVRLVRRARSGALTRVEIGVVAAGLLGIPLLLRCLRDQLQIGLRLALIMVVCAAIGATIATIGRRPLAWRAVGLSIASAALTLLVVGLPKNPVIYPGQVAYVTPDYGSVLFGDGQSEVDKYAIFANLHTVVPTASQIPGELVTWSPPGYSQVLNVASAQYLWHLQALPASMPEITAATTAALVAHHPRLVVMLSDSGAEFARARAALAGAGYQPRLVRQSTLHAGADVLWVCVVELTNEPA